jgi:serine phosphatase RsbU (regulator of sigma subunit)
VRRDGRTVLWPQEATGGEASKGTVLTNSSVTLRPGDAAVLYTSGVLQATNHDSEPFGEARLIERLNRGGDQSSSELVADMAKALQNHTKDHPRSNDIAMLAIRRVE